MSQPPPGTEAKTLLAYLNAQREHVLGILDLDAARELIDGKPWLVLTE